jgi:hypothetical protein
MSICGPCELFNGLFHHGGRREHRERILFFEQKTAAVGPVRNPAVIRSNPFNKINLFSVLSAPSVVKKLRSFSQFHLVTCDTECPHTDPLKLVSRAAKSVSLDSVSVHVPERPSLVL